MGDQNHLLETVLQSAQQLDDVEPPGFVQRAEHFIENEQREILPGALSDHL
jgi:hypothetical protein